MPIEQSDRREDDDNLFGNGGLINFNAVERRAKRLETLRQKLLENSDLPADATLEEIQADVERRCGADQGPDWFDFRTGGRRR
jgi:hypothetical protein